MNTYLFDFTSEKDSHWTMEDACENLSKNPAPDNAQPCIYIIHNSNTNHTYVGYAEKLLNRWKTRAEVFHTMGIDRNYAKNVLCAYCVPAVLKGTKKKVHIELQGQNAMEHILIRAVVNGLLGQTTNTNTVIANTPVMLTAGDIIHVVLPQTNTKTDRWGYLEASKSITLPSADY
jgi:hypothetical protein